jgi:hypothetical protein
VGFVTVIKDSILDQKPTFTTGEKEFMIWGPGDPSDLTIMDFSVVMQDGAINTGNFFQISLLTTNKQALIAQDSNFRNSVIKDLSKVFKNPTLDCKLFYRRVFAT